MYIILLIHNVSCLASPVPRLSSCYSLTFAPWGEPGLWNCMIFNGATGHAQLSGAASTSLTCRPGIWWEGLLTWPSDSDSSKLLIVQEFAAVLLHEMAQCSTECNVHFVGSKDHSICTGTVRKHLHNCCVLRQITQQKPDKELFLEELSFQTLYLGFWSCSWTRLQLNTCKMPCCWCQPASTLTHIISPTLYPWEVISQTKYYAYTEGEPGDKPIC